MKTAGRHLIIDGILKKESKPIVSSVEKMSDYLTSVTNITGMTLVIPPISMKFPFSGETRNLIEKLETEGINSPAIQEFKNHIQKRDTQDGGVSAITIWLESHASLHSWPDSDYISIDLFSCKVFAFEPILDFTMKYMNLKKANVIVLDRMMDGEAKLKQFSIDEILWCNKVN